MSAAESAAGTAIRLVPLNLTVLGGGFAWFAYIDAPITDGAMTMFAAAVVAGLVSVAMTLYGGEFPRASAAEDGADRRQRSAERRRRAAVITFLVSLALMLASATVTLNLKGTGGDSQDTQTAAV